MSEILDAIAVRKDMRLRTLQEVLDELSVPGELYTRREENAVQCYACGHRCLIKDGRRGICQVRFNKGGTLYVPWNYVAALQVDPTEKKPFFHVLPGSQTLTFGMLGCDFHCSYCFTGDTSVVTDQGVLSMEEIFRQAEEVIRQPDGEVAVVKGLKAVTGSGRLRPILKAFRHRYTGPLVILNPYYLPPLRCTPDHRIYATTDPKGGNVQPIAAGELTVHHYLAIPRRHTPASSQVLDAFELLQSHRKVHQVPHALSEEEVAEIIAASEKRVSSRELGRRFGKPPDYIRHVRSKVRRRKWVYEREISVLVEDGRVRFPKEHWPGIPRYIPLDEDMAYLLGVYCAEGCVTKQAGRPGSYTLVLTSSPAEKETMVRTGRIFESVLGFHLRTVHRDTTTALEISKGSMALLFSSLCGASAREKRVPLPLFYSPQPVVEAFLDAYAKGDGHYYDSGKVSVTTVSRDLAYGVAWLLLKLGHLPSVYAYDRPVQEEIEGRTVRQASQQFSVVWYTDNKVPRRYVATDEYYLIPLRSVTIEHFDGQVYNLEVEKEHNYLANFFLVKNCQNWLSSQTLRDPSAGVSPTRVTPEQMIAMAERHGARCVASSYNEPLITSEWALATFKLAKQEGLRTLYVSNGNATREVLEYLRPWLDGYKIDLKTMNPKHYRELGGVLEHVLETIRMTHEMGFWVEVVTLVVPGWNDSEAELRAAARFIASISPDIPWHVTAFHPDYKMADRGRTQAATLMQAAEIGREEGLHFVYAGNLPGMVGRYENTCCPDCGELLIERYGFYVTRDRVSGRGTCPSCGAKIPGIWS